MPTNENQESRKEVIDRLLAKADIVDVTTTLGFEVFNRESTNPRIRCPFHSDQRPSLTLYRSGVGEGDHYHCFSCSAHGGILDLIQRAHRTGYSDALEWLADFYNEKLPPRSSKSKGRKRTAKASGLEIAAQIYSIQTKQKKEELREWAATRKLPLSVLRSVGACIVWGNELYQEISKRQLDGEECSQLEASGMVVRPERTLSGESPRLPINLQPRDFFKSERILFPIHNDRGRLIAFAGRALKKSFPKYLFSSGFRKSETLYCLNEIRKVIRRESDDQRVVHLFLVEGIMDVLRLKYLKQDAVAILGNQLTKGQVELIVDFADDLDRHEWSLIVHIFLDGDAAGRKGASKATFSLLKALTRTENLHLDVVIPPENFYEREDYPNASPKDPDEWLKGMKRAESEHFLQFSATSPMRFLLSHSLGVAPSALKDRWEETSFVTRQQLIRSIQRRFSQSEWGAILQKANLFEQHLRKPEGDEANWEDQVLGTLTRRSSRANTGITKSEGSSNREKSQPSFDARLIHAFQLAKNTKQNREAAVDVGSWERIEAALDVFIPYFREVLKSQRIITEYSNECRLIPFLIPKGDNEYRLKALPIPEILTLQQYFLNELLRSYPNNSRFQELIPAVRSSNVLYEGGIKTTGPENLLPVGAKAVSFAYTVDMDVVDQVIPQRNAGAFVPYRQCWRNFLTFIDSRIRRFPKAKIHVARLDIRRYYNSLPQKAVTSVLTPAVQDALAVLESELGDHSTCLQGFLDSEKDAQTRGIEVVNWLNVLSFGYRVERDEVFRERFNLNGLPQGPELSAYLANIALFPLDRRLSELVNEADREVNESLTDSFSEDQLKYRGAVYARYVDDMVIAARSSAELNRLRSAIESQLSLLGMELNPKSEQLPPMDRDIVREWLTDQRGDGFTASGPADESPIVVPDAILPILAGPDAINRKQSLRLLYNIDLVRPNRNRQQVLRSVKTALSAPELRHSEHVAAASILWRLVIQESDPHATKSSVKLFEQLLRSSIQFPRENLDNSGSMSPACKMAAIDGIERILDRNTERHPAFSHEEQESLRREKERLAEAVGAGLCDDVVNSGQVIEDQGIVFHLEGKVWVIRRLAAAIVGVKTSPRLAQNAPPSFLRAFLSLGEMVGGDLTDAELFSLGTSRLTVLHYSIAALRSYGKYRAIHGESTADPLATLQSQMQPADTGSLGDAYISQILALWTAQQDEQQNLLEVGIGPQTARHALMAFVNVCCPEQVIELLQRRRRMVESSLTEQSCRLIPNPPGLLAEGLMCIHKGGSAGLTRIDVASDSAEASHYVPKDGWDHKNGSSTSHTSPLTLSVHSVELKHTQYLSPRASHSLREIPQWLEKAYRELINLNRSDAGYVYPPHALNLLGPSPSDESKNIKWGVFGYGLQESDFQGQAVRRGKTGLVPVEVPEDHSHLWRVGVALSDWLGLYHNSLDLMSNPTPSPDRESKAGDDWIIEGFIRFSLFHLRGAKRQAGVILVDPETNLPQFVDRALKRLKSFPTDHGNRSPVDALAHFLASLAEGRAFHTAYDFAVDSSLPGATAAILLRFTTAQFRVDEALAHELPEDDASPPEWAPEFRPALAAYCLSRRIAVLNKQSRLDKDDHALSYLAAGLRLQCADFVLQALATQLWSLLDEEDRLRFQQSPPSIANWGLDGTALLTVSDKVDSILAEDSADNVEELFRNLYQATRSDENADLTSLQTITPLGWLVVIGAVCGQLPGYVRGDVFKTAYDQSVAFPDIQQLIPFLTFPSTDTLQIPWGMIGKAYEVWTDDNLQITLKILEDIATKMRFRSEVHADHRFYLDAVDEGGCEAWTSDGKRQLPWWTISTARAANEQSRNIETVGNDLSRERIISRWSEVWHGDKLVGLGIVRPQMASLAGKHFDLPTTTKPVQSQTDTAADTTILTSESDEHTPERIAQPAARLSQKPEAELDDVQETLTDDLTQPSVHSVDGSTENAPPSNGNDQSSDGVFDNVRVAQAESWKNRSVKAKSHVRVAFFQWDLDQSYSHPLYEVCEKYLERRLSEEYDRWFTAAEAVEKDDYNKRRTKYEQLRKMYSKELFQQPHQWKGDKGCSCAEFRRRELLKRVLQACNDFDVQILLLPEYSVRPETVQWIEETQKAISPDVAIWAGTYRLPPGMTNEYFKNNPWSAVLEIIPPRNMSKKRTRRNKKYPSVAADEVFHPLTDTLVPAYDALPSTNSHNQSPIDHSIFDPRAYAFELICSEAFLMTSPTNLIPVAHAFRRLAQKFGINESRHEVHTIIGQHVQSDLYNLAQHTAHGAILAPRRTICLVPAMTSRAEDYTALGQAGYLASGITTVFCNAAKSKYSNGSSCFVGHNGWKYNGEVEKYDCSTEPYHGVRPGVFQLSSNWHGKLGPKEQALVIADIDPIYAAEGRPRPQMLQSPLQLVAHLPVFETADKGRDVRDGSEESKGHCRCNKSKVKPRPKLEPVIARIDGLLNSRDSGSPPDVKEITSILYELAKFDDRNKEWLVRRADAHNAHHQADPNDGLPPSLLDWLDVHVDYSKMADDLTLEIEMPSYAQP